MLAFIVFVLIVIAIAGTILLGIIDDDEYLH